MRAVVSVQKQKRISKSKEAQLSFRSACLAAFSSPLVSSRAMSSGTFCDDGNALHLHCPVW